ncbi:hypothetical protein Nizo1839_2155 [Lactiplantibacillus plantarum]|nr:hypothetical protein Nizo1839_2155 [Lactiplantibacillus plantarum]
MAHIRASLYVTFNTVMTKILQEQYKETASPRLKTAVKPFEE